MVATQSRQNAEAVEKVCRGDPCGRPKIKPHENQGGDKPRPYKRSKTFSTDSAGDPLCRLKAGAHLAAVLQIFAEESFQFFAISSADR
jgi:hypothetical protein